MEHTTARAIPSEHQLAVIYRPVGSLKPDPRNARTHPKRQIEQLVRSIQEFGFTNPVLIDEADVLIAGHGRLRAAREIGLAEIPTITLVGLSDAQKKALRLADNKIALNAGWDLEILKLELDEIGTLDVDFDLSLTGFSSGEIDVVLKAANDPDDEIIPAVPTEARTKLGDVWILGDHRLGCGDGRDLDFLRRVVGKGALIDAAFLDPPYNVKINGHANAAGRHREFAMASGEMSTNEFRKFLSETLGAAAQVSRDGAVHFVCMDWRHLDDVSAAAADMQAGPLQASVSGSKSFGGQKVSTDRGRQPIAAGKISAEHQAKVVADVRGRLSAQASIGFDAKAKANVSLQSIGKSLQNIGKGIKDTFAGLF